MLVRTWWYGGIEMSKKIIGWTLQVEWDNGKTENITDLESFISSSLLQDIDDALTELEESK